MVLAKKLYGKLFGDKGYISKKLMLRKRFIIETINDQLKNISQIEHSRHRSPINFLINVLCGLIAYTFQDKKPCISGLNKKMIIS